MLLWALGLAIRHWALAGIRGVLLRIVGGGVLPGSPNPDPTSDQEIAIFHTRFQTWPLRNDIIITSERQQNIFFKIHFEFASDFSFFLVHLELKQ